MQAARFPERVLLCDRGTCDGAAYWPGEPSGFFEAMDTSLEAELERYDAVIFFESAAVAGLSIEGGNPNRTETAEEACTMDARLRAIWSAHPRFQLVPHSQSFLTKITHGLECIQSLVDELGPR